MVHLTKDVHLLLKLCSKLKETFLKASAEIVKSIAAEIVESIAAEMKSSIALN